MKEMISETAKVKKWKYKIHKKGLLSRGKPLFMKGRLFNMDMELKFGLMILNTGVDGNMDNSQDRVNKHGELLIQNTLAVGKTDLSMVKVSKLGMMGLISMGNGFMMLLKGVVLICGPIKEFTSANGKIINYMEEESSIGLTVVHTSVDTLKTVDLVEDVTHGLTANLTMENGRMVSKMEKESS